MICGSFTCLVLILSSEHRPWLDAHCGPPLGTGKTKSQRDGEHLLNTKCSRKIATFCFGPLFDSQRYRTSLSDAIFVRNLHKDTVTMTVCQVVRRQSSEYSCTCVHSRQFALWISGLPGILNTAAWLALTTHRRHFSSNELPVSYSKESCSAIQVSHGNKFCSATKIQATCINEGRRFPSSWYMV